MEKDKQPVKEKTSATKDDGAVERGKKAIDANKLANGQAPQDPATKKDDEKDAANWRNEG